MLARRMALRAMSSSQHTPVKATQPKVGEVDTPTPKRDKGKGKERESIPSPTLSSALEEALNTPITPPRTSLETSFEALSISQLPQAHYALTPHKPPNQPRLLSQLTRSTLPTATLTYAAARTNAEVDKAESSGTRRKAAVLEEQFPDLDPTTGLPLSAGLPAEVDTEVPPRHLQRTITGLLAAPRRNSEPEITSSFPYIPSLPFNIPGLSRTASSSDLRKDAKRGLSTSNKDEAWSSWATGWWGTKKKVDSMMDEDDQADTIEEEKEKLKRKYRTPKNPIVFCHGLLGFDYVGPTSLPSLQISHWRGIREVLEANGVEVLITRVPATASIADRASILAEAINEKFPGREVNLIGHSMGGLDCRYLVSELRPQKFKPVSVTTISTPHRGSPFADYLIDGVIGRDRLPSLLSVLEALHLPQSGDGSAFNALSTRSMKAFNTNIVDDPNVSYYSWGASFEPGLLDTFRWPHSVILAKEGPNDGLVSVTSARWGEYRGTLLGVNHLDLVGWVNHVRYAISGWTGNPITFKPATFYLEVSDYLAEQGF